ncbi:MAG TPA: efflux RND transporter periplasmic adaptor subunit [Polyangia bacterium]|nr:efflux RND transporter periplasmic adaptor subunit [Polyangia bacterium]
MEHETNKVNLKRASAQTILVALPLALAALGGCSRSAATTPAGTDAEAAPIAVKLVPAQVVKAPRVVTLSGSLIGAEEADVAAGAAGKVLATYVERGSNVKKGAILARLDARAVTAQAAQAAADAESAKAQAAQAQLDCGRVERLNEKGAISKADYDKARTQCQTAKWSVEAADARKSLTAEALRDTEIRAPFSGEVVERAVTAGEYVRADSRVVTLVNTNSLRVEITVPESDVALVKQGMQIDFRTAGESSGKVFHGKIRYVGPAVRKQSRDAVVEAVFANDDHDLRPGMFVTARLAVGEQELPAVPTAAVRADGNLRHVFVDVSGRLEDRLVQTGETLGAQTPIVSGLKPGEQVVAELTPDVRDGAKVR